MHNNVAFSASLYLLIDDKKCTCYYSSVRSYYKQNHLLSSICSAHNDKCLGDHNSVMRSRHPDYSSKGKMNVLPSKDEQNIVENIHCYENWIFCLITKNTFTALFLETWVRFNPSRASYFSVVTANENVAAWHVRAAWICHNPCTGQDP